MSDHDDYEVDPGDLDFARGCFTGIAVMTVVLIVIVLAVILCT